MDYLGRIEEGLAALRKRIEGAASRVGRDPASVELLAVSKFHPIEVVQAAWEAGLRHFGESRVQEAEAKYALFAQAHPDLRLDMLGHLQGNKVARALGFFTGIASIDSVALLESVIKRAGEGGLRGKVRLDLLLEFHTAEDSKSGFASRESLMEACALLAEAERAQPPTIRMRGLMTMAPLTKEEAAIRASFRRLRLLGEEIRGEFGFADFDTLSMGMSSDFELAIEEGATLIRIGTALFGELP